VIPYNAAKKKMLKVEKVISLKKKPTTRLPEENYKMLICAVTFKKFTSMVEM